MLAYRFAAAFLGISVSVHAAPVRIILVGDSTLNDEGGWGPGFRAAFADPSVEVVNLAKNGRSSKSFRDEGLWAKALSGPKPDYVLIQFGHNDCPGKGPERETDPQTTYRANLTRYIEEVLAAGGKPVLLTSIVRRNFNEDGSLKQDCLVPFVNETRRLGEELGVPVMDLYRLTWAQAEILGPKKADQLGAVLPDGKPDRTHLGPVGQREVGLLAANELVRVVPALASQLGERVSWNKAMGQKSTWYGSAEAVRIAELLLLHQHQNGGWLKNIDMAVPPVAAERAALEQQKKDLKAETTIDNGATWTQMQYLARVHTATKEKRFADSFRLGLRYLLQAQYPNGGWPQFYPLRKGYYTHITYNDNALIGVLNTLRSVAEARPDYAFLNREEREQARTAVARGTDVILKSQIVVDGKKTVWCAQHDEVTLAPVKARTFEPASFSGGESVGLVRFLMSIERPGPGVIEAVEGAVAWFRMHAIHGIREDRRTDPSAPKGFDKVVVRDPEAPPIWARFYDLKTGEPIFTGRDSIPRATLAEIEYERRTGYNYYVSEPGKLLDEDYPRWKTRIGTMLFGDTSRLGRPGRYLM